MVLTIFHLYRGVSLIGGGNRSTWRKPSTCRKSLTNFIACCIEYTSPELDLNSPLQL